MSSVNSFRKNGLVIFGARMASIVTGMLFLLMVTGWLRPQRFGLWEFITDLVTFASYPAGLLTFWASRDIARGRLLGKTVILLNLAFSLAGLAIYAVFALPTFSQFNSNIGPFLLAALLVPLAYWNQAAASVGIGYRPAAMGYSLLVSEAAKLLVAYPALYIFKLEINGVILALITAYVVQSAVITAMARGAVIPKADFSAGKKWLTGLWVPALYLIPSQVGIADTFVASLAAKSTLVTGYYQVAFQLGSLVSYAGLLASALYPLLLRGGSSKAPSMTLDLILMFATPMAVGEAIMAPQLLAFLSPAYVVTASSDVSLAVIILACWGLLYALSYFSDNTLMGVETADLAENRSVRSYLRSSFLFIAEVNTAYLSLILIGVYAIVAGTTAEGLPIVYTVEGWAGIQLLLLAPAVALKLKRVKTKATLEFPRALTYYVACSAIMAVVLFAFTGVAPSPTAGRVDLGKWVVEAVVLGAGSYFGVLLLVNRDVLELARSFVRLFSAGAGASSPRAASAKPPAEEP